MDENSPERTTGRKALTVFGVLGVIAVFLASFAMSAVAITAVAKAAGISSYIAWMMTLAVDGLMLTGTVVFVQRKLRKRSLKYPAFVLGSGVALSVVCNALHSQGSGGKAVQLGTDWRVVVSAIPAVALALSFHMIADMIKDSLDDDSPAAETVSGPVSSTVPDTAQNTTRPVSRTVSAPVSNTPLDTPQNTTRPVSSTRASTGQNTPQKRAETTRPRRTKAPKETREEAARRIYDAYMAEHHEVISNAKLRQALTEAGHPTGNRTAADLLVEFKAHPLRLAQ